jgi:hypothetical protein
VRGSVTVNGAAMPAAMIDRGQLAFVAEGQEPFVTQGFGSSGAASYDVALLPGRYTIEWRGNRDLCGIAASPPVPCNQGVVRRDVNVSGETTLDVDVPIARVRGTMTLNGAQFPQGLGGGFVEFTQEGSRTPTLASLRGTVGGPTTYDVALLPGTYSVAWRGIPLSWDEIDTFPIPSNGGVLERELSVSGEIMRDLEIGSVRLRASVTINGMPAADVGARGQIAFVRDGEDAPAIAVRDPMDDNQFQLRVLPGTYSVRWMPAPDRCGMDRNSPEPCNSGVVQRGIVVMSDTTITVDVPSVRVRGSVTANGEPLPEGPNARGSIVFLQREGSFFGQKLEAVGPSVFDMPLVAGGSFVTLFDPRPAVCKIGSATSAVPCGAELLRGCTLQGAGAGAP